MRAVIQRVDMAEVRVGAEIVGAIGLGILALVAVVPGDDGEDVDFISRKLRNLRVFDDEQGRMNRSLADVDGELLLVSQFTLMGDCRKGNRPSFSRAAEPVEAQNVYEQLVEALRSQGVRRVETGRFRARMTLWSINNGPVTLLLDSREKAF